MAFCTVCGASVNGAFCSQCGTPSAAGQASAAPPPNAAPPVSAAPPAGFAAAPATAMPPAGPRKTSPIVWVLVALGGLFLLGIIGVIGVGALVVHKAHQSGFSADLLRRNPAAAVARMALIGNKDVEIVSEDDKAGNITVRDRHTGKTVTMAFDQVKNGIRFSGEDENGKTAVVEFGAGTGKLPSWIPSYPGSDPKASFSASGTSNDGSGAGGNYTFTTNDDPTKVLSFYQDKVKDLHMIVKLTTLGTEGGTIIATEDPDRRMLTVVVGRGTGETTVNVTYGEKR